MAAPIPKAYPETSRPIPPSTPTVQIEQPPKRNKFFKPALITLGIVLVIVISEIGYLVFKGYGKTYFQLTPDPTPTPVFNFPLQEEIEGTFSREFLNTGKARDFLEHLDLFEPKLEFIQNATLTFTVGGIVDEVGEGEIEGSGHRFWIIMKGDTGEILTYRLTEQEIQNASIFLETASGLSQIEITEIKPGDFVLIRNISNLLDSSSHFKVILKVIREQGV